MQVRQIFIRIPNKKILHLDRVTPFCHLVLALELLLGEQSQIVCDHDDVIKWKHFPRYWPFVRGIHGSRGIPRTKASDAELWCFLWSAPE